MKRAYVFIETAVGRSREIAIELQKYEWVECAERVAGPYDIVVMVQAHPLVDPEAMLRRELEEMDGIIRMVVCPIAPAQASAPMPALTH